MFRKEVQAMQSENKQTIANRKYREKNREKTNQQAYKRSGKLFGSFTVELKYFRSMPWYKAIFLSNFFNFILVLFRTLWYNRVG